MRIVIFNDVCVPLVRIIGCRLSEEVARASVEPWLRLQGLIIAKQSVETSCVCACAAKSASGLAHPNIVAVRDVFSTTEFGDAGCKLEIRAWSLIHRIFLPVLLQRCVCCMTIILEPSPSHSTTSRQQSSANSNRARRS